MTIVLFLNVMSIGLYPLPTKIDHAIRGEKRAKKFLENEKYSINKINKVLHSVRSHRCYDVLPETIEAKIIAFVDSASHMTDTIYFDMAKNDKEKRESFKVYEKIKRDFRDLSSFPEIKKELGDLYKAWINLLRAYEKINLR